MIQTALMYTNAFVSESENDSDSFNEYKNICVLIPLTSDFPPILSEEFYPNKTKKHTLFHMRNSVCYPYKTYFPL